MSTIQHIKKQKKEINRKITENRETLFSANMSERQYLQTLNRSNAELKASIAENLRKLRK